MLRSVSPFPQTPLLPHPHFCIGGSGEEGRKLVRVDSPDHLAIPVCPVIREESNQHTCCLEQVPMGCLLPSQPQPRAQEGARMPHWGVLLHPRLGTQNGCFCPPPRPKPGPVPGRTAASPHRGIPYSKATPHCLAFINRMWCGYQTRSHS